MIGAGGGDERDWLRLAASLEQRSEHPLAAAVVGGAKERGLELARPHDFESITGGGIKGTIEGASVLVGRRELLEEQGTSIGAVLADRAEALRRRGRTVVHVAVDGTLAGILAVSDPPKEGAAEAIRALRALGLRVVMLTGDAEATALAVAAELGIDEVEAGATPQSKHDRVVELKAEGLVPATASTTRPRWRPRTSALPWERGPTSRSTVLASPWCAAIFAESCAPSGSAAR